MYVESASKQLVRFEFWRNACKHARHDSQARYAVLAGHGGDITALLARGVRQQQIIACERDQERLAFCRQSWPDVTYIAEASQLWEALVDGARNTSGLYLRAAHLDLCSNISVEACDLFYAWGRCFRSFSPERGAYGTPRKTQWFCLTLLKGREMDPDKSVLALAQQRGWQLELAHHISLEHERKYGVYARATEQQRTAYAATRPGWRWDLLGEIAHRITRNHPGRRWDPTDYQYQEFEYVGRRSPMFGCWFAPTPETTYTRSLDLLARWSISRTRAEHTLQTETAQKQIARYGVHSSRP